LNDAQLGFDFSDPEFTLTQLAQDHEPVTVGQHLHEAASLFG
jgi:hypothetical protein